MIKKLNEKSSENNTSALEIKGSTMARNTALNFAGFILPLVVGIVTIPFTIRGLGTERFGILSLAWVIVGYFSFFDLGLGRATTKFVAEAMGKGDKGKVPNYFWTTVFFQVILGLVGLAIVMLITPLLVKHVLHIPPKLMGETMWTFYWISFSMPIVMVSASFRGILEAGQRFDMVNVVKVPSSIMNFVLPVAGILLGWDLPGIMILLVASRVISLLAWMLFALKVFPVLKTRIGIHRESVKPLLSYGGWVTISNFVGPILVYLDRFLIGSLITIEAVGFYSAPYEFIMRLGIIPASLGITLFPAFSALQGSSEREKTVDLFGRSVKYVLLTVGSIAVLLVIMAKYIIGIWLGDMFLQNSIFVFQILAFGFLVYALASIPYGFLQGIGRADLTAKFHVLETIFYVPLTWILIKRWGINGAAVGWTIRMIMDTLLLFWASWKYGRIRLSSHFRNSMIIILLTLSVYGVSGYIFSRWAWGLYGIAALTACEFLFVWFYIIDKKEKEWIFLVTHFLRKRISP